MPNYFKYLKYKFKYLNLKNQYLKIGGDGPYSDRTNWDIVDKKETLDIANWAIDRKKTEDRAKHLLLEFNKQESMAMNEKKNINLIFENIESEFKESNIKTFNLDEIDSWLSIINESTQQLTHTQIITNIKTNIKTKIQNKIYPITILIGDKLKLLTEQEINDITNKIYSILMSKESILNQYYQKITQFISLIKEISSIDDKSKIKEISSIDDKSKITQFKTLLNDININHDKNIISDNEKHINYELIENITESLKTYSSIASYYNRTTNVNDNISKLKTKFIVQKMIQGIRNQEIIKYIGNIIDHCNQKKLNPHTYLNECLIKSTINTPYTIPKKPMLQQLKDLISNTKTHYLK